VQLTPEWEGRIRKADPYFPNEIGETWTFQPESEGVSPPLSVTLVRRTLHEEMNCVESELRIRPEDGEDEEVAVVHLLYTAWPDHGVPEQSESLLRFVRYCEQVNSRGDRGDRRHQAPMAVGCSAGIGRTGSFITISSLLEVLHDSPDMKPPDGRSQSTQAVLSNPGFGRYSEDLVVLEIDWLREQRGGMVQRREQMEMIYGILCA
jgi:protein tyrosine phosphatase